MATPVVDHLRHLRHVREDLDCPPLLLETGNSIVAGDVQAREWTSLLEQHRPVGSIDPAVHAAPVREVPRLCRSVWEVRQTAAVPGVDRIADEIGNFDPLGDVKTRTALIGHERAVRTLDCKEHLAGGRTKILVSETAESQV